MRAKHLQSKPCEFIFKQLGPLEGSYQYEIRTGVPGATRLGETLSDTALDESRF